MLPGPHASLLIPKGSQPICDQVTIPKEHHNDRQRLVSIYPYSHNSRDLHTISMQTNKIMSARMDCWRCSVFSDHWKADFHSYFHFPGSRPGIHKPRWYSHDSFQKSCRM